MAKSSVIDLLCLWEQEGQGQYAWHVCLPLIPNPSLVYCELQNICFHSYSLSQSIIVVSSRKPSLVT